MSNLTKVYNDGVTEASLAAAAWDEGALAQSSAYGMQVDAGPNPYRTDTALYGDKNAY